MSILLRQLVRYVAQKAASDPEVRTKVIRATSDVVEQAKQIVKEDDRARAAGKALRRVLDRLQNDRDLKN
jgi:mevalonate kinase